MKYKRYTAALLCALILVPFAAFTAAAEEVPLTIEIARIEAEPGDIVDIPVMITSNPGVSVIKDLRIELRKGLNLYFPQGKSAYDNNGTAATWPYEPAQRTTGNGEGMLPVMGRPTAANISEYHIVLNFLDVSLPFDSTATGTLVTLKVQVADDAEGEIFINLSGGMYGDISLDGDKAPVLINGSVSTGDDEEPATGENVQQNNQTAAPEMQIPHDMITAALEEETPRITLTPDTGTIIPGEAVNEIIIADKPVTVEYSDGVIITLDPEVLPTTGTDFDLMDIHPDNNPAYTDTAVTGGDSGSMPAYIIILLCLGFVLIAAIFVIALRR